MKCLLRFSDTRQIANLMTGDEPGVINVYLQTAYKDKFTGCGDMCRYTVFYQGLEKGVSRIEVLLQTYHWHRSIYFTNL